MLIQVIKMLNFRPGPQPADIFEERGQSYGNLLLYLNTKHVFKNFGRGAVVS